MSKIFGMGLALTLALVAIPTLVISASAAPIRSHMGAYGSSASGSVAQDPDLSIRGSLWRDEVLGN